MKTLVVGQDAGSSLRSRAVHSGAWIGVGFGIQKVLQLGSNLILTRLLFPEAFGLMALATVFLVGLAMFSDIGLKPAVIRDPRGDDPEFLNTAWTIQVVRGFLLCVIGAAIAYPVSLIYQQPILFPLLAVLSTTAAISGFASIGLATAERRLDFRKITMVQLAGQLVSIILLVTLAYFWRSVWALAVANVISSAGTVLIGYAALPRHQHRFQLEPYATKSLVHFGKWIFLSTVVTFLGGEGLRAIQAGFLTPAEFGVLAIAYTIAAIPIDLSMKLTAAIGLPAFSEAHRNHADSLSGVLHQFRKRVLTFSFILVAMVAFTSDKIVELLYDERYHAAGAFVVAITLSNAAALIGLGYNNALLALGKSRTYSMVMACSTILRIIGIIAGFKSFGILGMIAGVGAANVITLTMVWPTMHRLQIIDIKLDLFMIFIVIVFSAISIILL
ncbi:MAG: oligosaccharide flippase family protein [Sphingopyxis solisilvae]